jgi:hypothetical protein
MILFVAKLHMYLIEQLDMKTHYKVAISLRTYDLGTSRKQLLSLTSPPGKKLTVPIW